MPRGLGFDYHLPECPKSVGSISGCVCRDDEHCEATREIDESVGPFPQEPAFGSPEAVAQAAEYLSAERYEHVVRQRDLFVQQRDALQAEVERLRAGVASWKAEEEDWKRREADLLAEVERLRHHPTENALAIAQDRERAMAHQRDALADALVRCLEAFHESSIDEIFRQEDAWADGTATMRGLAALKLAGRLP